MKIVVDENIPYGLDAFGTLGQVVTMPGRAVNRDALKDIDALIVRSITKVNRELLEGTSVRFVGTATIGTDHLDTAYLASAGIGCAGAPGSNAISVAEYVMTALFVLAGRGLVELGGASIGVIGVGNVGSRVARMAKAVGLTPVLNDPPLARRTGDAVYRSLEEALACDIVTLHVPLTTDGPDATYHLAGDQFFEGMKPGAVFINSSRGAVTDSRALAEAIDSRRVRAAVLDVHEREPELDPEMIGRCALATPHIAGYSFDGKVAGTKTIYEAACRAFELKPVWTPEMPKPALPVMTFLDIRNDEDALRRATTAVYPVERDDDELRRTMALPAGQRAKAFDRLRKEYPIRREFHNTKLVLLGANDRLAAKLEGLGFKVRSRAP